MVNGNMSFDVERLRDLYGTDPAATRVLDYFASRERNSDSMTVEQAMRKVRSSGGDASKPEIVRVFKAIQECGCGEFKVGRRGWKSRFEFTVPMITIGKAAAGATAQVEGVSVEDGHKHEVEFLKHTYRLRPDITVNLELPKDLSTTEAIRVAEFVKTLPFV